ncbi:HdeD family acid-resistance protein [Reticulibacter mediterranei]|nr:DUF308 domain-containing protein [Reticulibacter mediterranei]
MRPVFASGAASTPWWLIMITGIAAFIGGLLLLVSPGVTLLLLEQLLGAYWLVTGTLSFVSLCIDRTMWGWKLVIGILGILAGLAVLRHPLWSTVLIPTILMIFLAIDALIIGVLQVIHASSGGGSGLASLGILNIIFGLILWFNPLVGVRTLPIILGICAVIGGSLVSIRAFALRPQATHIQPPGTQPI